MKRAILIFSILTQCIILFGQDYIETEIPEFQFTTSFYDSTDNSLYAGGSSLIRFSGDSWSYLPQPDTYTNSIIKYKDKLYVGGRNVYKFDGEKWMNTNYHAKDEQDEVNYFLISDGLLYVFSGNFKDSLTVWDGSNWNKIDPGVSEIGCRGITNMYCYNNDLYANSTIDNGASVIIKKENGKWIFPNGTKFNTGGAHSCEFQNKLYLSWNDRIDCYDGEKWGSTGFYFHYGYPGSDYISSIRSNKTGLFVCGKIDNIISDNGNISTNNLVMLCGNGTVTPLDAGLDFIADINFYNNKIYAFGNNYFSIINNINKTPIPQLSIKDTVLCEFEALEISEQSNSGIKWLWQFNDTLLLNTKKVGFDHLDPGVYSPKITLTNCTKEITVQFDSLITIHNNPIPTITIKGDSLYSSSPVNNKWFLHTHNTADIMIDTTNSIYFNHSNNSVYVIVSHDFGCSNASFESRGGKPNLIIQKNASIIPNPNNGIFDLKISSQFSNKGNPFHIEIFDTNGHNIRQLEIPGTCFSNTINISDLEKGIYFIKIDNGLNCVSKKLIIK